MSAENVIKSVRLPRAVYPTIERAARAKHKSVHAWMREALLDAAAAEAIAAVDVFTMVAKALASLEMEERTRVFDGLDAFFDRSNT